MDVRPAPLPAELAAPRPRSLPPREGPSRWNIAGRIITMLVGFGVIAAYCSPDTRADKLWAAGVWGLIALLVLVFVALAMSDSRTRRELIQNGEPIAAQIYDAQFVTDDGDRILIVRYKFLDQSSNARLTETRIASLGFTPGPGDTVFVLYDIAKPKRHIVWGIARP